MVCDVRGPRSLTSLDKRRMTSLRNQTQTSTHSSQVLYSQKAGIGPAFQFLARGSLYRLPPVLFAIHAPPGRDRVGGCSLSPKHGRYKPFFEPPDFSG